MRSIRNYIEKYEASAKKRCLKMEAMKEDFIRQTTCIKEHKNENIQTASKK